MTAVRQMGCTRGAARAYVTFLLCLIGLAGLNPAPVVAAAAQLEQLPADWLDDSGQHFHLSSLRGHVLVLTMAYASCHRVCPLTMERLQRLQRDYDSSGIDAQFVIVGYDPEADDPATWKQYRRTRHLTRSNWHFLVGSRAAVEQTARQLGFEFWRYDRHVMHDARIVYFNEHGALIEPGAAGSSQHSMPVSQ